MLGMADRQSSTARESPARPRPDWRGWVAVAWAVFWGSAYLWMVLQARAPGFVAWIRTATRLR
jgi:hypothetical protein